MTAAHALKRDHKQLSSRALGTIVNLTCADCAAAGRRELIGQLVWVARDVVELDVWDLRTQAMVNQRRADDGSVELYAPDKAIAAAQAIHIVDALANQAKAKPEPATAHHVHLNDHCDGRKPQRWLVGDVFAVHCDECNVELDAIVKWNATYYDTSGRLVPAQMFRMWQEALAAIAKEHRSQHGEAQVVEPAVVDQAERRHAVTGAPAKLTAGSRELACSCGAHLGLIRYQGAYSIAAWRTPAAGIQDLREHVPHIIRQTPAAAGQWLLERHAAELAGQAGEELVVEKSTPVDDRELNPAPRPLVEVLGVAQDGAHATPAQEVLPWDGLADLTAANLVAQLVPQLLAAFDGLRGVDRDLALIRTLDLVAGEAKRLSDGRARNAVYAGAPAAAVGRALGISRQAAHKRFAPS